MSLLPPVEILTSLLSIFGCRIHPGNRYPPFGPDRFPFLPIVIFTGFDDDETGILAVREGAQDYLVKGQITSPSLMRSIRSAHERKRTEQELVRKNNDIDRMNEELRQNLDELTKQECGRARAS